jgi:hypothetical protein
MLRISTGVPSASCQWVMSACQRSLGMAASNRVPADLGRLRGCGVTKPRRARTRQLVETAGIRVSAGSRCRWTRIVSAPASRPFLVRVLRSRITRSSSSGPIAKGLPCGRLERGWKAAAPSAS